MSTDHGKSPMINVLFAARAERWETYQGALLHSFGKAGLAVDLRQDFAPEEVDYIVYAPNGPISDFTPYTRLKAVLNLWAGVEDIVGNSTLTVPLCRMVDPGLTEGMVEWVTAHVLRYHLNIDAHVLGQNGSWQPETAPLARERTVGILGAGALGQAVGRALAALNFRVIGWGRTEKSLEVIETHAGSEGLEAVLRQSEILILLLPLTADTENILDASALVELPEGAFIINAGRGPLIEDEAILAALDAGQIAHATLDVFRVEPLPPDHPFWAHPKITVTPHIAAETRAVTASDVISENIRRGEAGEPFLNQVDREAGY